MCDGDATDQRRSLPRSAERRRRERCGRRQERGAYRQPEDERSAM
jgi:hypothetical protein